MMSEVKASLFRTIVVDPPWKVMGGPLIHGVREGFCWQDMGARRSGPTRPVPYRTMTTAEMAALPVADLAEDDCALWLWTINAYVEDAYDLARAWGFKPSTLCVWAKNPMGGGLGGALGISTEFFLYARRGSPVERRHTGTWFNWKRHYVNGKPSHSAKPDAFYDLVEQVNDGPRVEMFARRARLGWDYHGDESLGTVELARERCPHGCTLDERCLSCERYWHELGLRERARDDALHGVLERSGRLGKSEKERP